MAWSTCRKCGSRYLEGGECPSCPSVSAPTRESLHELLERPPAAQEEPRTLDDLDSDRLGPGLHLGFALLLGSVGFTDAPNEEVRTWALGLMAVEGLLALALKLSERKALLFVVLRVAAYGTLGWIWHGWDHHGVQRTLGLAMSLATAVGGWALYDRLRWNRWISVPLIVVPWFVLLVAMKIMVHQWW